MSVNEPGRDDPISAIDYLHIVQRRRVDVGFDLADDIVVDENIGSHGLHVIVVVMDQRGAVLEENRGTHFIMYHRSQTL